MSDPLDTKIVSRLAAILKVNDLAELEYETETCRISLIRSHAPVSAAAPMPFAPAAGPETRASSPGRSSGACCSRRCAGCRQCRRPFQASGLRQIADGRRGLSFQRSQHAQLCQNRRQRHSGRYGLPDRSDENLQSGQGTGFRQSNQNSGRKRRSG